MIDDAMIKRLAVQCGCEYDVNSCSYGFYDRESMVAFAKACYAAGLEDGKAMVVSKITIKNVSQKWTTAIPMVWEEVE